VKGIEGRVPYSGKADEAEGCAEEPTAIVEHAPGDDAAGSGVNEQRRTMRPPALQTLAGLVFGQLATVQATPAVRVAP
jgi:hypothetical protein